MSVDNFACSICYEKAVNPVVTRCGHLFCWGCLDCWLSQDCAAAECPVCRGRVDREIPGDIIPLYGAGRAEEPQPPHPFGSRGPRPSTQNQQRQQAAGNRGGAHAHRPAADRVEPEAPRRRRRQDTWVGIVDGFFFIGSNLQVSILAIFLFVMYYYGPWQYLMGHVRRLWNGVRDTHRGPQAEQGRADNDPPVLHPTPPDLIVRRVVFVIVLAYIVRFVVFT